MPIYEYECTNGHRMETWQHIDAARTRACDCGAMATRIISAVHHNIDVAITPADVRRAYGRDTDYDRHLAGAFPAPWRRQRNG